MQPRENVHDIARGKWKPVLIELGVPAALLTGKHQPCPFCGGSDRFRFADFNSTGSYICNQCGKGSGVDLLMKMRGLSFIEAADEIRKKCGTVDVSYTRATDRKTTRLTDFAKDRWQSSHRLSRNDLVTQYLGSRGLKLDGTLPSQLRFNPRIRYAEEGKPARYFPAMVSQFVCSKGKATTVHVTYLSNAGGKADVDAVRKLAPGPVPIGGAVRLAPSAETMGIAEGIETALSAAQLFDIPVWAALNEGLLSKWEPPKTAKHVIIFGDNDPHGKGQIAAWTLHNKLYTRGISSEVRIPTDVGADWNDELMSMMQAKGDV